MSKRITIKQIAAALHVSISTVSKALNDSYEISSETKRKIKEYAKKHKYKPNTLALSLQNKKTKTIGIIIPDILNHFFARVFSGIEKVATQKGYNMITCITNESYHKEVTTMEMLDNGSIDGFIACISEETLNLEKFEHFNRIIDNKTPLVLYDRVHKSIDCDKVVIDNIKSAYKATRYLMRYGCKNIAFISSIEGLNVGKFRAEGYKKALTKYGVKVDEKLTIRLTKKEELTNKINEMLDYKLVDGIFTVDESSAAIAIQVLNSRGLSVPDDVAIIGFTNGILSKHITPPLTTVNQFGTKIGEISASRLIDKIEGKIDFDDNKTEIIRTELIERKKKKKAFIKF